MTDQVLTFIESGVGRIRLNRPKAIHALTPDMCEAINAALLDWADDDRVVAVMIDHAEGRGFCAGGDIALIASSAKADCVEAERFFHLEYRMNHLLFIYEKPIVAFVDGIVMGGGVGLSLPARFRVATERTTFAMPENRHRPLPRCRRRLVSAALAGTCGRMACRHRRTDRWG